MYLAKMHRISLSLPMRPLLECLSSGEIALSHSSDDGICTVDRRVTEIDCLRVLQLLRIRTSVAIRHIGRS